MNNFEYYNPTRIVFGKGTIAELDRLVPRSATVMMTYGGGSIKRNGVYEQVREALSERKLVEFGGIPPNPTYEVCMEAVAAGRREDVDFLVAVGGGSVLDGTKFISAAIPFVGDDPWLFMAKRGEVVPTEAIPLGTVLTLPATGSEMNPISVMSRESTREKRAFDNELLQPAFSILDPETTFSLPKNQVRNGIVDAFMHTMEQYMTYPANAPLQDRQAEAVFSTLIEVGPVTLENPTDYDARATLMWCATAALNRHLGCGVPQDWATHMIGHELTAFHGMAHAESLAVVLPARLKLDIDRKREKLSQYARRVWGFTGPEHDAATVAIERTIGFCHRLGMPTSLADYGIDPAEAAERVKKRFEARNSHFGEYGDVDGEKAARILSFS